MPRILVTGGATNSFTIIQPDNGTSPVADNSQDTLTFTSSDASITITGDSTTDTINFTTSGGSGSTGTSKYITTAITILNHFCYIVTDLQIVGSGSLALQGDADLFLL